MPIPKKVINYLDKNDVKYEILQHRKVYTAFDAAATMHLKESQIAKNLLLKADKDYILAVLPANRNVDFDKLAKVIGVKKVSLPKETVLKNKFKVKPGALPGFGGLYNILVFVDKNLTKEKKIIISSGSYQESISMTPAVYVKLEDPQIGIFSLVRKKKKVKNTSKKR